MDLKPLLFTGKVMHKRFFPKVNGFHYGIFYLACPLSRLQDLRLGRLLNVNRPGVMSFYNKDHGPCDGSDLQAWAGRILKEHNLREADGEIILIAMPRLFGYVFNPVSFWLCLDKTQKIRAVLCEVNNTFGERHTYICAHDDRRPIEKGDLMRAEKIFHVSPFMHRDGFYTFRFDYSEKGFGAWIDYYTDGDRKKLVTSLLGQWRPYSRKALWNIFLHYPLISLRAIALIHWQAFHLLRKGVKYVPKPLQRKERVSEGRSAD